MSTKLSGIVRQNTKVRGNMNPDPSWEMIGSYNGQPVYRERTPNWVLVEQIGRDGKTVYVKDPKTGLEVRPRVRRMQDKKKPWLYRDLVLVDLGNGIVKKNYDFKDVKRDIAPTREEELTAQVEELAAKVAALVVDANSPTANPKTEGEAPKKKRGRPRKAKAAPPKEPAS